MAEDGTAKRLQNLSGGLTASSPPCQEKRTQIPGTAGSDWVRWAEKVGGSLIAAREMTTLTSMWLTTDWSRRRTAADVFWEHQQQMSQGGPTRGTCLSTLTNLTLSLCLSPKGPFRKPPNLLSQQSS